MVAIEIELIHNKFGGCPWMSSMNEGKTEIIPSPLRICRAILSGMYEDSYIKQGAFNKLSNEQQELILMLARTKPNYYLPQYRHTGSVSYHPDYVTSLRDIVVKGKKSVASRRISFAACIDVDDNDSSIMVFYDICLNSSQRQMLKDAFEYLTYLGRSEYGAKWKLLRQSVLRPNCFPSESGEVVECINSDCDELLYHLSMSPQQSKAEGYRLPPCLEIGYYKLNAIRTVQSKSMNNKNGQLAVISIDPKSQISKHKRLDVADKIHRSLIQLTDGCNQIVGKYDDGSFVGEDCAVYIVPEPVSEGEFITSVSILSRSQFDPELTKALKSLKVLKWNNHFANVRLIGISEYEKTLSHNYRTVIPALVSYEVRNAIHRSASAQFINDICLQLGYREKIKDFEVDGDYVVAQLPDNLGWIKCASYKIEESTSIVRGTRIAASRDSYYVQISSENPLDVIAIGKHRKFGYGVLESF